MKLILVSCKDVHGSFVGVLQIQFDFTIDQLKRKKIKTHSLDENDVTSFVFEELYLLS